jgi:queuosine precursor transporter
MPIILYLAAIVAANVLTAKFAPINLGWVLVPAGTLLVGASFVLRDLVQEQIGRKATYKLIFLAMGLSGVISYLLGDTLLIMVASAVSFVISESMDTEIYSRVNASKSKRVLVSGVVGGTIDSVVFVLIGLSPVGSGILPWEAIPAAIFGQVVVKFVMQLIGAVAYLAGQFKRTA